MLKFLKALIEISRLNQIFIIKTQTDVLNDLTCTMISTLSLIYTSKSTNGLVVQVFKTHFGMAVTLYGTSVGNLFVFAPMHYGEQNSP